MKPVAWMVGASLVSWLIVSSVAGGPNPEVLCGMLAPPSSMPSWLEHIANVLPMTYAWDALSRVVVAGDTLSNRDLQIDIIVIVGTVVIALMLGAATLKRRSA